MKKFCTKCGREFEAIGREVICPACKQAAAAETKRAAVERAKRASWTGESVPVRISGRASTVIRKYGTAHNLPFAAALDELLKSTTFFQSAGKAWGDITPYKSRRRDRNTTAEAQAVPQEAQEVKPQEVKQAAKVASKASASKTVKAATGKAASKTTSKK